MNTGYSVPLVVLSIIVAVIASYVAIDLASRVASSSGRKPARYWLVGGAASMGIGIWSMHFIGMLALKLPIRMSYNVPVTLLSLALACLVSGFALYTINRGTLSLRRLLSGGVLMGAGIASMHYTGMAAMEMQPPIRYDMVLFGFSIVVAVGAAIAALWIVFRLRAGTMASAFWARTGSALLMGAAISGMHYTGMAAAQFAPDSICTASPQDINNVWLAGSIGVFAFMFLASTLLISLFDVHLADRSARFAVELRERNVHLSRQAEALSQSNKLLQKEMEERTRTQRALQESETRFRGSFDSAAIGMALVAIDGHWLQVNRAICRTLGYNEAELLTLTFQQITHPDDLAADLENVFRVLSGKIQSYQIEKRYLHKDGLVVWALLSVSLVRDALALPVHFIAQIEDISARKQAEAAVLEGEQRFQLVVQGTHDGIWDWNITTGYCYYSPRYKELLHSSDAEFEAVRDSFEQRLHPEDREHTSLALRAHLTQHVPYDVEYRLRVGSGAYKWFHARGQASWDVDGNAVRFAGALHDITDRKQSELAVERSQKFLNAIIDGIPQPVFVKDSQHRWVLLNQRFCAMLGRDREALLGRSDPDVYPSEVVARVWAEDDRAFAMQQPLLVETSELAADGAVMWLLKSKQRVDFSDQAYLVGIFTDITPQKQTEIDLRASEERFRGLTQLSTDWFWEQDEHFRFVAQSGGGLTRMNITPERMMGKTRWELDFVGVSEATWTEHKAILEAHLAFHDLEMGRQNDNGDTRYITISGEPVFDETGKFKGYRGVGRDITARKQVEQALQASEESHRLLAENSSDMILRITPQGTLTYVSPASLATLGYKPEELVGSPVPEFIHPDDREEAQRLYGEVVRDNVVKVVTCRLRRRDGTWTWTETSFRPVRDENTQRTVMVIGVSRNVEERVRVSAALNTFKDVLDQTLDMILMCDAETLRFSYVNQGTAKALGYSRDQMLEMSPWLVRADVNESDYRRSIEPFLQGTMDLRQFESVYRRSDGSEFPVDVTMQIVRRPHELPMFISVARDASERKKLDRMKNEFVSTVSHELRTPLTSIRGSLGLIAGGAAGELPAQAKKLVAIAYNNSERLVRLINDILDMEKIESGNMRFDLQPHRLRLLLEQAVEATRAYGEQLGVGFKIRGEIPDRTILADSDRFMQVMANLLSNAAKFSPSPGVVEVTAHRTGAALRICVTDHGPGIPLDFRDKIFGKFSQADSTDSRQKGGTGLGLSIIKAIVEKHGGEVGFDSEIGSGTTFHVSFPEVREDASVETHPNGNTERCVLVCEDDPETASAIATILATGGFTTQIAPTLSAARALLVDQCYVAVTLDLLLPDGDGIDLIRELRQRPATRTLPIVVVSIDAENGRMRLNESASQVTAWLDKPLNHSKLLEMVRGGVCGARSGKARILHVEDDADVKQVVSAIAADVADFDFASTVSEASALLGRNTYSLVILDLELQDGSGWKVLTELNGLESPPPVIVFTAQNLDAEQSRSVAATLTKGNTSNQHLLEVIKRVTEIAEKASVA